MSHLHLMSLIVRDYDRAIRFSRKPVRLVQDTVRSIHSNPGGPMRYALRAVPMISLVLASCTPQPAPAPPAPDLAVERAAVDSVLTALHTTASRGDWDTYFALYAPDAVFYGTDATERWSLAEFRGYAANSRGWTYDMTERHVFVDADASTAWFDEKLRNAGYGETRGTGVLVKTSMGWKVVQYNLTFPIPNDLAGEFTSRIKAQESPAP